MQSSVFLQIRHNTHGRASQTVKSEATEVKLVYCEKQKQFGSPETGLAAGRQQANF
jgi:hypothetical protein